MTTPPKPKAVPTPVSAAARSLQKTIGRNLMLARQEAGLSQRALSAAAGISQRHISAIELGEVNVTLSSIADLAAQVGKTPSELLTPAPRKARKAKD